MSSLVLHKQDSSSKTQPKFPRGSLRRVLLITVLCSFIGELRAQSFSDLVIFGDSLSDTGNLAIVNFPPPYFENRISDGPLLVDRLASALGKTADASEHLLGRQSGLNFAVAGGNILGSDAEDLTQQVTAFLDIKNNKAPSDALYFVLIGGNDIRGLRSVTNTTFAYQQIDAFVATLVEQLQVLQRRGAQYFVIPNMADIGRIPETLEREAGMPGVSARLSDYSRRYNLILEQRLGELSNTDNSILLFDLFTEFAAIIDNPGAFGFTTATEGCFDPDEAEIELECVIFGFDRRVFFDSLHPSSKTNQLISIPLIQQTLAFQDGVFNPVAPAGAIVPAINLLLDD